MKFKLLPLFTLIITLTFYVFSYAKEPIRTVEGIVTKVSDGDTVHLKDDMGTTLKIRLYGIDAPETEKSNKAGRVSKKGQPYGEEAYRALQSMIDRKRVKVDIMAVDQYKRMVGIIWLDGKNINQEMVSDGWAWAYRQYLDRPHSSEYIQSEEIARRERKGLWQQSNPQPPWEFRKMQKKSKKRG